MNSTIIFIDAGFLSKLSKYFGDGKHLKFDYINFCHYLAENKNLNLKNIFYYTAPPFQSDKPTRDEISRKKGYDKFIQKFKKNKLVIIREGRVQRLINSKGDIEFNQKGVDTLMTLDLALINYKSPEIKELILVTSDTDFCPVISELKKFNMKINLYTYSDKKRDSNFVLSSHLIDCCEDVEYLKKEDMLKFLLK